MLDFGISILAGGKSSRMGEDKGLMSLFGKPMVEYVLEETKKLQKPIQIIANNSNYKQFKCPVRKDKFDDKGPLAGIYTALSHSTHDYNLILSCDVPYVKMELLEFLLSKAEGYEVTLAKKDERIHPLIGVYRKSLIPHFENEINSDRLKILDAIQNCVGQIVDVNDFDILNFKNINSKSDLSI